MSEQPSFLGGRSLGRLTMQFFVAGAFLIPLLILSVWGGSQVPGDAGWSLFLATAAWAVLGAGTLLYRLRLWELSMQAAVTSLSEGVDSLPLVDLEEDQILAEELQEARQTVATLTRDGAAKDRRINELIRKHESTDEALASARGELVLFKTNYEGEIKEREALLHEYQNTIAEQRGLISKRQSQVEHLEGKVRDLGYEVKTLLQINEGAKARAKQATVQVEHPVIHAFDGGNAVETAPEQDLKEMPLSSEDGVHTPYDAAVMLQKCIDTAERLSGASRLGGEGSRFLKMLPDSYAIDLRRLFDSLRSVRGATLVVYNVEEKRVLFVNGEVRNLLGWSPERFVKDFSTLIQRGAKEWQETISNLKEMESDASRQGTPARLVMKSKTGEDILLRCCLGLVSRGMFAGRLIGVLYPTVDNH